MLKGYSIKVSIVSVWRPVYSRMTILEGTDQAMLETGDLHFL